MSEEVENLAFKDRKELANLNSIDLLNIIEFLQQRIDKAIEVLKLCNSKCSKETIEILKGKENK